MFRILVAHGDKMYRSVYRHYLIRHGYEVEVAEGGVDCLEKMRQGEPDVLILDLNIPWGGGEGVLAVLRDCPRLGRIPVLLTSGVIRSEALARLASPPLVQVLNKPGSLLGLCEQVESALAKAREHQPDAPARERPLARFGLVQNAPRQVYQGVARGEAGGVHGHDHR